MIARADISLMPAKVIDRTIAAIDEPDDSPELERLAALPRRIDG